jgi:hypothetical protein
MQKCAHDYLIVDIQKSSLDRQKVTSPTTILFKISHSQIVGAAGCSQELMDAISQLVKNVKTPDDKLYATGEYKSALAGLKSWLKNLSQTFEAHGVDFTPERRQTIELIAELYRLAALVYLERVGRGASRYSLEVEMLLEDSFVILEKLDRCERPFPLFIVACEAQTDAQRQVVLDILNKTKTVRPCGNLYSTKVLVEAAWIQDDLHEEHELSALAKYNAIMSTYRRLPSFA